jgi:endonuclease YncB( thermonuclease family)
MVENRADRRQVTNRLKRDEARRIAVNVALLPSLWWFERGGRLKTFTSIVIVGLVALAQPARTQKYSGNAISIQDGVTFTISDAAKGYKRVRLCGVDIPELGERAYQQAKSALAAMIDGKTINCVEVGSGTPCDGSSQPAGRGRIAAQCRVEGNDIAT